MKLISIEPTPSPNSMKLNVEERLPAGVRHTFTEERAHEAPPLLARLLGIPGVKSVFQTADFIALDRKGGADWTVILDGVRETFGLSEHGGAALTAAPGAGGYGEAHVKVQMFRGIPMQIRVFSGGQEERAALAGRFVRAVNEAAGSTMIRERKLEELGVRYGDPKDILEEVEKELEAAYPDERLTELVTLAKAAGPEAALPPSPPTLSAAEVTERLQSQDWRERYAALERLKPTANDLQLLAKALADTQMSIRRLAVVYLGDLRSPEALPLLFQALKDSSAAVRRTAGDTLSDLGDPAATGPMTEALRDGNKLVRWRAARFLYEAGDESALEALRAIAAHEQEFEVKLQAEMAVARIERGEEAAGSVWQQMTRMREETARAGKDT